MPPSDAPPPGGLPTQLALPLRLEDHAAFETLVVGRNAAAIAHVRALAAGARGEVLWIWGTEGAGKSHLLQAACRDADEAGARAMYVSFDDETTADPGILTGLEALDFLALDGLDALPGRPGWERALFSVLNEFYARRAALRLVGANAPGGVRFGLADLASRAAGATVYRLHPLDDDDQLDALQRHAHNRGFELDSAAARFLQTRVQRDMAALCAWLQRLDAASLAARRRITIPFIRDSLAATARDST